MTTTDPSPGGGPRGGRYEVLSAVAGGGMGEVWLAHDTLLDRRVALKSLRLGVLPNRELRGRAFREAKALARVAHPGIVGIYDVFVEDGDPWLVMEYVEGRTLAEVLRADGALPPRSAAGTALALLDALDAAHRNGVVHRDVKPANVLVEEDGRVRLVDFGIALVGDTARFTGTGLVVGTAEYMAPERFKGADAGPPADLWSLGVLLFEMLEGFSPFRRGEGADAHSATLYAVIHEAPPRPVASGRLTEPVLRLLEKDPDARLTSESLRRTLRAVLDVPSDPGPIIDRPHFCGGVVHDQPRDVPETTTGPRRPKPPATGRDTNPRPPRDPREEPPRDPDEAAVLLRDLPPEAVRDALAGMGTRAAGAVLRRLPGERAAQVLAAVPVRTAGAMLTAVLTGRETDGRAAPHAAAVLQMLGSTQAGGTVGGLAPETAAAVLRVMPPDEAARILSRAEPRAAAGIIGALPVAAATRVVDAMPVRPLCAALGYVPPAVVADLLRGGRRTDTILRDLDRPVREQVRRRL
ncbi:serine/threonine-protein kinase [Actinomadura sp. WMMB 499]|uniref:serine/threonine-protein kinase n=1 Tax=Actinomadura sp. WMMB 499 TaxID=1219491 RepID=UPI00159D118C|nr:protein kinase [Actinomadura sp. WMMB 499]